MDAPSILVLGKFYRSRLQIDLHDQLEYRHYFIFEAGGVVNYVVDGGGVASARGLLGDKDRVRSGVYFLNGSKLYFHIPRICDFRGEIVGPREIRLSAENDVGYFDSDAVYHLAE